MAIPTPEVGQVISYSFLWSDEAEAGQAQGRKNRPCAIVLVVQQTEGAPPVVAVVPITHSPHRNREAAIEILASVKRHLDLDDLPSWIAVAEFNLFTWPGFDLRPVPGQRDRYDNGFLPPALFKAVIQKFSDLRRRGLTGGVGREEDPAR
jgi:hypothetical protein